MKFKAGDLVTISKGTSLNRGRAQSMHTNKVGVIVSGHGTSDTGAFVYRVYWLHMERIYPQLEQNLVEAK